MADNGYQRLLTIRSKQLEPIADQLGHHLAPRISLTSPPTVLLLGNHSSGKSSMINHLLGMPAQRTGVAPTDDSFTFLYHGDTERTVDGHTITNDPDLPFAELASFGPSLVDHMTGRELPSELLRHVRLIDSPGMIDSVGDRGERQYDFAQVVHWLAERADLVLLFFDPEKPGTTGETMGVLTEALAGIDSKLRIVMNKMDLFDGLRDFARTYGALCWNLSRSLNTKDMPHIFTTVIPELMRPDAKLPMDGFASALLELEALINDLPSRRVDNVLNHTIRESRQLLVRARILNTLRDRERVKVRRGIWYGLLLALICAGGALFMWEWEHGTWLEAAAFAAGAIVALITCSSLGQWAGNRQRKRDIANLDRVFHDVHRDEMVGRDRHLDLLATWQSVKDTLQRQLSEGDRNTLHPISNGKAKKLEHLITDELPALRGKLNR